MTSRERELERKLNLIVDALGGEEQVERMVLRRVVVQEQVTQARALGFVHTAETFYRDPPGAPSPTPLCFVAAAYFNTSGLPYREPTRPAPPAEANAVVHARVYEGKWLVDCPDLACRSAQVACATDPRFLCNGCLNARHPGCWLTVRWPGRVERQEIERLLLLRPVEHRNWWPGETVAMLRAENVEHGLPAPGRRE